MKTKTKTKKIVAVSSVIGLLAVLALYMFFAGQEQSVIKSTNKNIINKGCVDTDGFNPAKAGSSTAILYNQVTKKTFTTPYSDVCAGSSVMEYYCKGDMKTGLVNYVYVSCPLGCSKGVCTAYSSGQGL